MGRPRKSIADHLKDGTYRRDRHGPLPGESADAATVATPTREPSSLANPPTDDAIATHAPPRKPADLVGDAAAMWDRLVVMLAGVVRERDAATLAEMCRWHAELRRVQAVLGKMTPGAKGYNQLLVAAGICGDKFEKLAGKFGMNPTDRGKLRIVESGPRVAKVPTRPRTKLDMKGPPR